ncbi:MAG: acyl carrier protein [candidate division Zixibacteria bacterium]|nr:acyl carrier protein [candidate division Zixibacteria bacterium]
MQSSDNVEAALISILHESGKLTGTISHHEDLFTELGVKSANSISILLAMEDRFGLTIDDAKFVKARTLHNLIQLVNETVS